jgi:hypothetical protein
MDLLAILTITILLIWLIIQRVKASNQPPLQKPSPPQAPAHAKSATAPPARSKAKNPIDTSDLMFIKYIDSKGIVTTREISNWKKDGSYSIYAFCHLRQEHRTFSVSNILFASDKTGTQINPWHAFDCQIGLNGVELIPSLTFDILPSIKALKLFSKSTKGFAARERAILMRYMRTNANLNQHDDLDIDEWLKNLYCGDIYAYRLGDTSQITRWIDLIPKEQIPSCREVAKKIATKSQKNSPTPVILQLIDDCFQ